MKAKVTGILSFLLFLTLVLSTPAFAQIFGADDETLEKIFVGLKKINSRLVNLETEELGSLKSQFENMLREIEEVKHALSSLKERERDVIKMYFGIDYEYALTLNEIGEEFGLTRERVRQIKEKAIRRLRHRSRSRRLKTYLG